jgi:hypothetical protein
VEDYEAEGLFIAFFSGAHRTNLYMALLGTSQLEPLVYINWLRMFSPSTIVLAGKGL